MTDRMRILQITYIFPPVPNVACGISTVVNGLSRGLARRKHDVEVYTSNALSTTGSDTTDTKLCYIDGVKVHYFRTVWKRNGFIATPSIIKPLKSTMAEFDIVHFHDPRSFQSIACYPFARLHNMPIVVQPHTSFFAYSPISILTRLGKSAIDGVVARRILRNATRVVAVNENEARQYVNQLGIPEQQIVTIPNGIDLSMFEFLPKKGLLKEQLGLPDDAQIILFLGRIHWIKGIDTLIRAFRLVHRLYEKVFLVIAGIDDGYLDRIYQVATTSSASDNIIFTGPIFGDKKLEAISDADFVVLPSRYESFGMVVLESHACGKPVIVSDAIPGIVTHGETGLVFKTGDIRELASQMIALLSNPDLTERFGSNSREKVEQEYAIDKILDRIESLYQNIV